MTDQETLQQTFDAAMQELPAKHQRLVKEYLLDLHQHDAAIRAGYTPEYANTILRNLKVAEAVAAGLALQAMPPSEVLARLTAQARGSMTDFLHTDEEDITLTWSLLSIPATEDGEPDIAGAMLDLAFQQNVKPTDRILHTATVKRATARLDLLEAGKRGKIGLIKKYSDDKGKVSIELYDAQAALALLGKHHKLFGDSGGILKSLDLSKLSKEQVQRIADGEDPLAVLLNTNSDPSEGGA